MSKEEVHWGLEASIDTGEGDDTQVPYYSKPIDDQKDQEKGICSSGRSETPMRMNSVTWVIFPGAMQVLKIHLFGEEKRTLRNYCLG
jgi:hypothetical protein